MNKQVLAIIGESAAGKETVVQYIKKKLNNKIKIIKFSDSLTEALSIFLKDIKREDQQWLINGLRRRFGQDILSKAVEKKLEKIKKGVIVLDGIRVFAEEEMIKRQKGKIIYVVAPMKVRWQRVIRRNEKKDDSASFEKFKEMHKSPSELEIPIIGQRADFKIDNSGNVESLYKQVDKMIKDLKL